MFRGYCKIEAVAIWTHFNQECIDHAGGVEKMIIKQAVISDVEEIFFLQKLAYKSEAEIYNDFNIHPLNQSLEEIKNEFNRKIFLKAVVDGKIIGSVRAFVDQGTCYIERFIVHPDFQNQGIGTKIMNEIEKFFNKAKRFELFTGHKSERNIHLYKKLGYRIFKTKKVNDNLDLVYFEKILAIAPSGDRKS